MQNYTETKIEIILNNPKKKTKAVQTNGKNNAIAIILFFSCILYQS
jgi:hypothetical protein